MKTNTLVEQNYRPKPQKPGKTSLLVLMGVALSLLSSPVLAELERVGPTSRDHGYPEWYQDKTGLTLEFGAPLNQAELDGGWCLILPADVPFGTAPETFPGNFADEHFYWAADASFDAGGVRARLILGLEAAFAVDVVPGDQIVFGRIRVRIDNLPAFTTYTVYHPFGTLILTSDDKGRIAYTEDIGISCLPGQFDCALFSNIGPFLLPSATPGGAELPAVTGPVAGKLYIAAPTRTGPVTGSPVEDQTLAIDPATGTRPRQNIFRVVGPSNQLLGQTSDFSLMGRIHSGNIPGRVDLERAVYARSATGNKLDVFASAFPTTQGRLPGQPKPAATTPVLRYYEGPCDANAAGDIIGAPIGLTPKQMFSSGSSYWGQSAPAAIPDYVCVEDTTAGTVGGQAVSAFFEATVTDHVWITEARFDPGASSLSVKAASSDKLANPDLILGGFEQDLVNGSIIVSPLVAPPSRVRVKSIAQGFAELPVWTGTGTGAAVPLAINDAYSIDEDSGPHSFNVLANDTLAGGGIPAGATVRIVNEPRLGAAAVLGQSISYTPSLNAFGSDTLTYTVEVSGQVSAPALVAITIRGINDPPVANPDSFTTLVGESNLNVLANDTDPDGNADLKRANFAGFTSNPGGAATVTQNGRDLKFTTAAAGIYTFNYEAVDQSDTLSALVAQVTVTVTPAETITIARAEYRVRPQRLRVDGTDSLRASQTLTIYYTSGTPATGLVIFSTAAGTAVVDANGAWSLDVRAPRPAGANGVLVVSSIGSTPVQAWSALTDR
jgi:hypothetical protein